MTSEQKDRTLFVSTIILVIIYAGGLTGLLSGYRNHFLIFTPINLLISVFLLFLNHKDFNRPFYIFAIIGFLLGYLIEVVGIKTGIIFGKYSYGNTFGLKILDVPLVIGLNWLMLIYCVGIICNQLNINIIYKSILGAVMLIILDYFIEPVATKLDFWSWSNSEVPLQNYIAWFIASFFLLLFFHNLRFNKTNKLAQALFIVQLVFFTVLSVF